MVEEADWVVLEEARTRINQLWMKTKDPERLKRALAESQRWHNRALEWARRGGKEILLMPGYAGSPFQADGYYQTWKEALVGRPAPKDLEVIRAVEDLYGFELLPPGLEEVANERLRQELVRSLIDSAEALGMAALAIRDEIVRSEVDLTLRPAA